MRTFPVGSLRLDELLKRTTSRCPACHAPCPAEVWRVGRKPAKVFLKRICPTHGETSVCIASDARFYWLSVGDPANASESCCADPARITRHASRTDGKACCSADGSPAGTLGRNAHGKGDGPFEKLSTCLALIEIVNSCNLACPTCYADSPLGTNGKVDAVPLEDLKKRIQGVIDRKGKIEILQLSGGEPTLHPQFFELLEWAQKNPGVDYLLLNTNGVRIASDEAFARTLAKSFRYGRLQLYLQFDGVQIQSQHSLRGADLRELRQRAIDRCGEMNLPITLAMTVTPENLPHLWAATEFGLRNRHIRGISFQPMFQSGRVPGQARRDASRQRQKADMNRASGRVTGSAFQISNLKFEISNRLNTADIILAAVEQSHDKLRFEDFTPLPCGDPNCATIGYLLRANGRVHSISDFIDFAQVQDFLQDRVRYRLEDLERCGCESEPLGELLKRFEMDETHTFRLFIKPFMDAWTWDEDRIDRCCTHVIRPDGKLDSFCRYYSGFSDCKSAPVNNAL
ncbi:MAG: radical SAM protein [Verrucomicrobia bacterium]|nr:radical SAM protein [Verrucomicrobiota bacterium]